MSEDMRHYPTGCERRQQDVATIDRLTSERDELLQSRNAERNRADRAEGELEAYRMRLAGALVAADGAPDSHFDGMVEPMASCPTIAKVREIRKALDAANAAVGVLAREVWGLARELASNEEDEATIRASAQPTYWIDATVLSNPIARAAVEKAKEQAHGK